MQRVRIESDEIHVGPYFSVSFERTLRIPDDGGLYPLPPSLGSFPLRRVRDFARRVPAAWRDRGGYFLPMYQCEALWLSFSAPYWHPSAVKVGIGAINAVSGEAWTPRLRRTPQDYLVAAEQPWLDGINAGDGFIRQFVAAPLGTGATVEGQITGRETEGGIQIAVIAAKPGRFRSHPPQPRRTRWTGSFADSMTARACVSEAAAGMGLGAGGRMEQKLYPDSHPRGTWDVTNVTTVHVHIATTAMWRVITGEAPPPSPVSAETYTRCGFPWFKLYDEHMGDIRASKVLAGVNSVQAMLGDSMHVRPVS